MEPFICITDKFGYNINKKGGIMMLDINMNAELLISILNTKLRNDFDSLFHLCDDLDLDMDTLEEKLKLNGYIYDMKLNQFRGIGK